MKTRLAAWGLPLSLLAAPAADAVLLGPTPYLCFDATQIAGCGTAQSPFAGGSFGYFHLETFEDGLFNVPGVSASAGGVTSVVFGPTIHDSVDEDDGLIDGSGLQGDSYFSFSGAAGITFTFDANALGVLPTHVGLVWTDGAGQITFRAFDALGNSLGTLTGNHADSVVNGTTAEDRFYGAIDAGGISSIFISNAGGGIEVDHLQYGAATAGVPEPSGIALLALGLLGAGWRRRFKGPS